MKPIIYKSFLPKREISQPEETHINPPSDIYRPQYNWKDPQPEATTSQQETQQSQEVVVSPENSPTWTNPSGTKIISDTNDPIYRTSVTTPRGQHQFKSSDIQVGEMQELLDRFADAGISLRITSGYRPGATTSSGNQSWHASGYALDVTPIAGQTYENLKQQLRNNPELVKWMQDNGFGIIDETTPEMQSRTGATGAHWHIGKDKLAQSGLQAILSARHGAKLPIITARSGRKLQDKVTSRLYEIADHKHKQQHPLTARTDKPLELVSIASILPGTGDVAEGASIIDNVLNKNIIQALISVGLFALPGNFSKVSKTLGFNLNLPNSKYEVIPTSAGGALVPIKKLILDKNIKNITSNQALRHNSGGAKRVGLPNLSKEIQSVEPYTGTLEDMFGKHPKQPGFTYKDNQSEFIFIPEKTTKISEVSTSRKNEILTEKQRREILDHEVSHYIDRNYRPDFYNSKLDFVDGSDYQRKATEVGARVGQLKDAAGITDGSKTFTEQELKNLFDDYLNNPKNIDNGISVLRDAIKDWAKFTNWVNQNVPLTSRFYRPLIFKDTEDEDRAN